MDDIYEEPKAFRSDGSLNLDMIYVDSQGLKRMDGTLIENFTYKDLFDKTGKIKLNILVYDELCKRYDAYAANSLEERYIFEYERESIFLGKPHRSRGIEDDDEDEFDDYNDEDYDDYREEESEEENYEDYDEPEDDDDLLDDLLLLALLEDDGSLDDF